MTVRGRSGRDILLTGWSHTEFGKSEDSLETLIVRVTNEAIEAAALSVSLT